MWATTADSLPPWAPEESRVAIYTDFENGIIVARQNPSVNADTGEVRAGTPPDISAVQQSNGAVLLRYNAADPFSPGGEVPAKASHSASTAHWPSAQVLTGHEWWQCHFLSGA